MNPGELEADVFYGELTVNRAYVYARLPRPLDDAGLSLVGQVRGPRCLHAQTLPLTSPLVDLGPGPTLLARALVPDPCFWSPDLPAIYDVTVNLLRGTELVASTRRELGFRSLGVRGRNFALEGKRFVLRGVSTHSTTAKLPRAWHEAAAAFVTNDSDPTTLEEASQWGSLAVVRVAESGEQAIARLRELSRFPSVGIAVVLGDLPAGFKRSDVAPNLLLANWISSDGPFHVAPWADVQFVHADPDLLTAAGRIDKPIVATRYLDRPLELDAARAACDALQRDLAPLGQFAGYVV
jgi:hypothetical protein